MIGWNDLMFVLKRPGIFKDDIRGQLGKTQNHWDPNNLRQKAYRVIDEVRCTVSLEITVVTEIIT